MEPVDHQTKLRYPCQDPVAGMSVMLVSCSRHRHLNLVGTDTRDSEDS